MGGIARSASAGVVVSLGIGAAMAGLGASNQDPAAQPLRVRGQVLVEGGGGLPGARIKTDAIRGPGGAQFVGQREFVVRTNRSGDWSLLGMTRGLWILELSAPGHLPHVAVIPIFWMRAPEPMPWDSSLALMPVAMVAPPGSAGEAAGRRVVEAAEQLLAGDGVAAREALRRIAESNMEPAALCAAGDLALLLREPAIARRFFERAASASAKWYRPELGIASASMMLLDFDRAMKAYTAARAHAPSQRLERMLSSAVRELQQIRAIGRD